MVIDQRARFRVERKGGKHVSSVKPLRMPLLNRINQVIVEKEILLILAKLNPIATQRRNIITMGVWFQTKEIAKQGDRRGIPRKASQR
jgi:hypothetical protein